MNNMVMNTISGSSGDQSSPVYSALSELRRQVMAPAPTSSRAPLHVLLRGEDLLRREVPRLKSKEATSELYDLLHVHM